MRVLFNAPAVSGTAKHPDDPLTNTSGPELGPGPLLAEFVAMHRELEAYRSGMAVKVDGHTLSIAAVTAAARYRSRVVLDGSPQNKERIIKSRAVITSKIESGTSVYGLSTGFGGSGESYHGVLPLTLITVFTSRYSNRPTPASWTRTPSTSTCRHPPFKHSIS